MVLIGLIISIVGLVVFIFSIRHYYKEAEGNKKRRWFETMFFVVLSAVSESSFFYLGALLILAGLVLAVGLL